MRYLDRITRNRALLFLIAVFLLIPAPQWAQNPRPRIGLALSGGGALGLAHIGVLRYLEEHRIPVDRIAGTSMGGLLGGLYATGHNAKDLERIVLEANWDDLLRTTPKYEDRIISEKQEWNRITGLYSIPLGLGFSLPAGINSGQALVGLLSAETAPYWDVQNFDDLPIPFRCVATDLVSGEATVLREGHLPRALRATMAIPGIFTPVQWNGRILVDGGLVNNFPADVAKDMGADVVIGVTLRMTPPDAESLRDLPAVIRQTANIAVEQNEIRRIPLADVRIAVEFPNRSNMDFSDARALIERGYRAATQQQAALERFALSSEQWQAHLAARNSKARTMPAEGRLSDVSAPHTAIQNNAAYELSRKTDPAVSNAEMRVAIDGVAAATGLPNAFYGWHTDGGKAGYDVEIETRRATEVLLRPSLFYQFSQNEPSRPTLKINGSFMFRNSYKSRFLGALYLGTNPAAYVEYYHPFGGRPYFVAPGLVAERSLVSQYVGDDRVERKRDRFSANLYFGVGTWRHVQLRGGVRAGLDRYNTEVDFNGVHSADTRFVNPEMTATVNTQDSGRLPTSGLRLHSAAGWSFRENAFPYFEMNFDHFHPVGSQFSLMAMGRADTSFGRPLGFYDQFTGGGLGQLDAYRYQEIRGDTLLMAGGGFLYRGLNPRDSVFRPVLGAWVHGASTDTWTASSQFKKSASVGAFAPTPLGILGLTFSSDLMGATRWRLSLGSFWNRP
jgi:NTE family protein